MIVPTVERESEAMSTLSGANQRTFRELSRMFRDGLVIPFLGAGAIPDIQLGDVESVVPEPPLKRALAYKLAEMAQEELTDVPAQLETYSLSMIAQYYQTFTFGGRPSFYNELKRCFPRFSPGPMHRLLVQQEKPLLVITSSYDTALEQVFEEQKKPYAVVTHISHAVDPAHLGKVLVRYSDRPNDPEIWVSDELSIDLEQRWVFYKIQGTFNLFVQALTGREEIDSILISEEDHFSFLSHINDQHRTIPNLVKRQFQRGIFLFFGYWMSAWNYRALMYILWQERMMRPMEGYTVRHNATAIESQFWKSKNVEMIEMEPGDFASGLAQEMGIRI